MKRNEKEKEKEKEINRTQAEHQTKSNIKSKSTSTSTKPSTTSTTTHHSNPSSALQLINPSSSPYLALTPTLISSDSSTILHHQSNLNSSKPNQTFNSFNHSITPSTSSTSYSSNLRSSTSQHTLKTLSGGKYYDEYDEDESSDLDQLPPLPNSASSIHSNKFSPHQASFPPISSPLTTPTTPRTHQSSPLSQLHQSQSTSRSPLRLNLQSSNSFIIDLTPPSASSIHHSQSFIPSNLTHNPHSLDHQAFNLFSIEDWNSFSHQRPLLSLAIKLGLLLFGSALVLSGLIWILLPPVAEEHRSMLSLPTSFEALKKLNQLLQIYKTKNYYRLLSSFILIYLFLQTFSLPGSMYLSILAGAMYGVKIGLPLVSFCVGTGALLCYKVSSTLGSTIFQYSPSLRNRLETWKNKLESKTNRFDLFSYLVVIRISPLPPHWVVNLLAPHVGIELTIFWFSTCIGIMPVTLIHTQLGTTLDQMVGPEDLSLLNSKNLFGLGLVAVGVLVPVGIRWYWKKDLEESEGLSDESEGNGRRIGLSSENEEEDRRLGRLRSLSGQSYDGRLTTSSSVASLSGLNRTTSTETLVLSLSRRNSSPHRINHRKTEESLAVVDDDGDDGDDDELRMKKKVGRKKNPKSSLPTLVQNSNKAARILGISSNPHHPHQTHHHPSSPVDGLGGISLSDTSLAHLARPRDRH
ncbi:hypothetical protein DFH28DRAFT_1133020 [Melampsora americana]|nr:hypothetical protein DFH28DRAFT_1133020 [Melampsora americana]